MSAGTELPTVGRAVFAADPKPPQHRTTTAKAERAVAITTTNPEAYQWRSFQIPDPISTNALTRNVSAAERQMAANRGIKLRGRVKTNEYKAWRDEAILEIRRQLRPMPHCPGPFFLDMTVGGNVDIDNTVKCVGDLLKHMGLIVDDKPKYMQLVTVRYAAGQPCQVAIRPVGQWA